MSKLSVKKVSVFKSNLNKEKTLRVPLKSYCVLVTLRRNDETNCVVVDLLHNTSMNLLYHCVRNVNKAEKKERETGFSLPS